MTPLFPYAAPDRMTLSARLYLLGIVMYCTAMAFVCLCLDYRLTSISFHSIRGNLPGGFVTWGLVHIGLALLAAYAAVRGRERPALLTLIFASAIVGAWAWGFFGAEFLTDASARTKGSPTGMIAYSTLTYVHLIQARQPLRSPFERLQRVLNSDV